MKLPNCEQREICLCHLPRIMTRTKRVFKKIYDSFREQFGHPVSLLEMLERHPGIAVTIREPHSCIAASSVTRWYRLGCTSPEPWIRRESGTLTGWKMVGDRWQGFSIVRPEYEQIEHCEITENWSCDITHIHGFSASKSDLYKFVHTDEMVEANCMNMAEPVTTANLAKNLAHYEIRIVNDEGHTSDHVAQYKWDGRLWLINSGGSHHTAAAKYQAARLNMPVKLTGRLFTYSLNGNAIGSLRNDYEMFVISDDVEVQNDFFDAMKAFGAPWLWHYMPSPFEHAKAILLPKIETRSMRVATEFRKIGVFDLGRHLSELVALQDANENIPYTYT